MGRARPSQEKIYIDREADVIIESLLSTQTAKFIALHANGGAGKSTLLEKFMHYEEYELPTLFVALRDSEPTTLVDMLLDDALVKTKHCHKFEEIKSILAKEPKLLNMIASANTDTATKKLEEYDAEWGEYAKILFDGVKGFAKWRAKDYESKKKEILANTEFVLLSALEEDFSDYGLLMFDTFEKYKDVNIKSKVIFKDSGEVAMSLKEQNYRLRDYVESLFYLFDKSSILLAGRNTLKVLNLDIASTETIDIALDKFSLKEIEAFFTAHVKKGQINAVVNKTQYAELEQTFARRTYDESGD